MNDMPIVDVIIPVYNRNLLLIDALNSVLEQTYPKIFIYIIEDGSQSLQHRLPCLKKCTNIIYCRLAENHGVSYSRNFGAMQGKGKYLAFLDSDDFWAPRKIEMQVEFLEKHQEYQWIHTNEVWFKNGILISQKKEHTKQGGIFFDKLMERCLISPSSVFFNRNFFTNQGGFQCHFPVAEDYELWLRLNLKNPVAYLPDELTIKRAGDWNQLSRTIEIDRWRVLALHRIYRIFKEDEAFQVYKQSWKSIILKKINILVKGAEKYNSQDRLKQYQNWSKLFSTF